MIEHTQADARADEIYKQVLAFVRMAFGSAGRDHFEEMYESWFKTAIAQPVRGIFLDGINTAYDEVQSRPNPVSGFMSALLTGALVPGDERAREKFLASESQRLGEDEATTDEKE